MDAGHMARAGNPHMRHEARLTETRKKGAWHGVQERRRWRIIRDWDAAWLR